MSKDRAFVIGAFGGGIFAEAITDGVDVFGGSFKEFVGGNAGVFVFDASVFEAEVEIWLAAGGENDIVDADHFFGAGIAENNIFADFIAADGNDFGTYEYSDAETIGEMISDELADFFVFARKKAPGCFGDENFGAKFGKVGSDFAASGTAANNHYGLRFAAK